MRTRFAVLIAVFALLAPASAALAQSNPFDGLPPAQPTPAPTVAPTDNSTTDDGQNDRQTLYLIAGGLLITFLVIGFWIARDARRNLPQEERDRLGRRRDEGAHKRELQAKAKARAKGRAQRQARKTTRKKARH